jgi:hypothetical protein
VRTEVVLEAIVALHDASEAVKDSDMVLARRLADAEGRLRGSLISELPNVRVRDAA